MENGAKVRQAKIPATLDNKIQLNLSKSFRIKGSYSSRNVEKLINEETLSEQN